MKANYDTAVKIARALGDCIRAEKAIRSAICTLQELAEKTPFAIDIESASECQQSAKTLMSLVDGIVTEQATIHCILTHHR
jgi:hypothetical protein